MARNTAYSGRNTHSFAQVPKAEHPRSTFNRSSAHKTTFDSGKLIPIYLDQDILPGDTINMRASVFARMATPIYPLLDQLFIDTFWFFVPNRLVWDKWAFFMGEEETVGDALLAPKYTTPQVTFTNVLTDSLQDYMGLPLTASPITVSALPFRALNLIWNEWFRDESIQARVQVPKGGGVVSPPSTPDSGALYVLKPRGKRKDYFTSCLPWPQKGPTVLLPLGATAPLSFSAGGIPTFRNPAPATDTVGPLWDMSGAVPSDVRLQGAPAGAAAGTLQWEAPNLTGVANLAAATSATINELRQSFQIQRLLERDARGGSRLTELLRSHFGVVSPDARLQRPEFLAGASVNVQMNPVPQTSETTGTGVQGGLAAYATAVGDGGAFQHSFTEHGILICLASIRAPLTYQQGLHKSWLRKTRFDHYWPALQAIGEQAVSFGELMFTNSGADPLTFGYQERWAEYRYKNNTISGQFRSDSPLPLDAWHLAQDFASPPTLNDSFIADTPPVSRVVAVPSEPEFLLEAFYDCKQTRVMPVYSVPGMIDHF